MIYLIQAVDTDLCKIGYAADIPARIASLQTACPHELVLLDSREGGKEVEAAIHRAAAAFHVRGEWFRADRGLFAIFSGEYDDAEGLHERIIRGETAREIAAIIGTSVHTVRSWRQRGSIPVRYWRHLVQGGYTTVEELLADAAKRAAA